MNGDKAPYPFHRTEKYPRSLTVNFRHLDLETLLGYVSYYNIDVLPNASQSELAVTVARHFELEAKSRDDEATINRFLASFDGACGKALAHTSQGLGGAAADAAVATALAGVDEPPMKRARGVPSRSNSRRTSGSVGSELFGPAQPGEQVGVKISDSDENGSWILATVKRYYPDSDLLEVQDEDELIKVAAQAVVRLDDSVDGLAKGDMVLAVFPDTTSFYRASISKPVKRSGNGPDVFVQFEDDEDGSGRTPHRRVSARYLIPIDATSDWNGQGSEGGGAEEPMDGDAAPAGSGCRHTAGGRSSGGRTRGGQADLSAVDGRASYR